ncbi:MAG: BtaA family protein [Gammaproteobacteria bacterium]
MLRQKVNALSQGAHDLVFRTVHEHNLIYNMCWEDPRIDRQLMQLDASSRVLVLTSAGCNTLDYLLDSPAEIHAVDVNPRQNALLELKLALIRGANFEDLFAMFGRGSHQAFQTVYSDLRQDLPAYAKTFWDQKIAYFDATSKRRSFHYYGTSGLVAWVLSRYLLLRRELGRMLFDLLDARTLEQQKELYQQLEPLLWGRLIAWIVRQPMTLAMVGVPRPQIRLISERYPGGIVGFVADKLKHVLTEVLIHDNYFWRAYLTGSYTSSCCPAYLQADNFEQLRANSHRVQTYNLTVSDFLRQHPGQYSHFVLLDHQDWLAAHKPAALAEEWQLILQNSRPGSRILLRSASQEAAFLPDWVRSTLRFFPEKSEPLHQQDRVGTYGSLHFAQVL